MKRGYVYVWGTGKNVWAFQVCFLVIINVIIFLVWKGHMGMFGGMDKIFRVAGMLFMDWKVVSKKLSRNYLFTTTFKS